MSEPDRATSDELTDLRNAELLVAAYGADLRYTSTWGWVVWDAAAGRWQRGAEGAVMRRAKAVVRSFYARAAGLEDDAARKALIKHAVRSESAAALSALLRLAESEPEIETSETAFDTHPDLLNCLNGVLDLRTGRLHPPCRELLLTKQAPVAYDPAALAPTWEAFLAAIFAGDTALIAFVQRAIGYALTGHTREKVFFLLHGPGSNNGKSTLLATLRLLLGDYARSAKADSFLVKKYDNSIGNDIASLVGARLVTASETEKGKTLAIALIKELSGATDTITVRFLRKEYFTFIPSFKIWLATNHLPEIPDSDNAIWNRIRLIPFMVSFSTPDEPLPGAPLADLGMADKLRAELPGILAWAVRGCLDWQARGSLQAPPVVMAASHEYRMEQDTLAPFLDVYTLRGRGPGYSVSHGDLFNLYTQWAEAHEETPVTSRTLSKQLKGYGFTNRRGAQNAVIWSGLGLRASALELLKLPKVTDIPVTPIRENESQNLTKKSVTYGNFSNLEPGPANGFVHADAPVVVPAAPLSETVILCDYCGQPTPCRCDALD